MPINIVKNNQLSSISPVQINNTRGLYPDHIQNIIKDTKSTKKTFLLTFDCGGDNGNIKYILDTLKKANIKATFFITGEFIKKYPNDVKRIALEGHTAANHTLTHTYYKSSATLIYELKETAKLYYCLTGRKMSKLWRAPYLQHIGQKWILNAAHKIGYRHIDVSLFTKDWVKTTHWDCLKNDTALKIIKNLDMHNINRVDLSKSSVKHYKKYITTNSSLKGVILLMHSGKFRKDKQDFVFTLEEIIKYLKEKKYIFDQCDKFERVDKKKETILVQNRY